MHLIGPGSPAKRAARRPRLGKQKRKTAKPPRRAHREWAPISRFECGRRECLPDLRRYLSGADPLGPLPAAASPGSDPAGLIPCSTAARLPHHRSTEGKRLSPVRRPPPSLPARVPGPSVGGREDHDGAGRDCGDNFLSTRSAFPVGRVEGARSATRPDRETRAKRSLSLAQLTPLACEVTAELRTCSCRVAARRRSGP